MKKFIVFTVVMLLGVTNVYANDREVIEGVNKVVFNVDVELYDMFLQVYNQDTGEHLNTFIINKKNNTFYIDKGINVRFEDVSSYECYDRIEALYLYDESKVFDIDRKRNMINLEFTTIYRGFGKYIESVYTDTDITIYDSNFDKVTDCKSEGNCKVSLLAGEYFVVDNKTGRTSKEYVKDSGLRWVSRYFIDGIYSEDDLDILGTTRKGKLYYFDTPAYPQDFVIDGEVLDFADSSNYYYIVLEGIFYKYNKKDEVIKEDETTKDNILDEENFSGDLNKDDQEKIDSTSTKEDDSSNISTYTLDLDGDACNIDEVNINVPNTENSNLQIIYFKKKKYV